MLYIHIIVILKLSAIIVSREPMAVDSETNAFAVYRTPIAVNTFGSLKIFS